MAAELLTSLANAKAWLGIATSTDDVLLSRLIAGASGLILGFLNRDTLLSTTRSETHSGIGSDRLMLRQWPVTAVASLSIDGVAIPESTSPQAVGWTCDLWDGVGPGGPSLLWLRGYRFTRGARNIVAGYTGGYRVSAEAAAVPVSPYQVTAAAPQGPFSADLGVTNAATGAALTKIASGTPSTGQYKVDASGVYTFAAADQGAGVLLSYSFIPAAIENGCFELVGERYKMKDRIGVISKSLGGQETVTYSQKDMHEYVKTLLAPYVHVVPA
jgi:hypothetical protein